MPHRPLGIGVIGAGQIVKRHALAYKSLPDLARLVAVADVDEKRAKAAQDTYGFVASHGDYADLLSREDIDVISICTPAGLHTQMAIDSLRAGKHVLCEKPLATTLCDADAIIAASEENPEQTFCCVFQLRADPAHQRMRWMIEQGQIGKVLLTKVCVRLRKSPGYYKSGGGRGTFATDGGGVVINQAIHQVDALLFLMGEPVAVSAVMDTFVHPIESEDTLVGWVRFESGAIATIECTTCAKRKEFSIDVLGERAGMRVSGDPDSRNFHWRVDAQGSAAKRALRSAGMKAFPDPVEPAAFTTALQKIGAKVKRTPWLPPAHWGHTPFVREFLEAAKNGGEGPAPARDARRSIALVTALYESAKTGRTVAWPLDDQCELYHGLGGEKASSSDPQRVGALTG